MIIIVPGARCRRPRQTPRQWKAFVQCIREAGNNSPEKRREGPRKRNNRMPLPRTNPPKAGRRQIYGLERKPLEKKNWSTKSGEDNWGMKQGFIDTWWKEKGKRKRMSLNKDLADGETPWIKKVRILHRLHRRRHPPSQTTCHQHGQAAAGKWMGGWSQGPDPTEEEIRQGAILHCLQELQPPGIEQGRAGGED